MAVPLEKTRNYQTHPTIGEERGENFGTYPPRVQRASRPAPRRTAPKGASTADVQDGDVQTPTTDVLEEEWQNTRSSRPTHRQGGRTVVPYQQQQRGGFPWMLIGIGIPVAGYSLLFVIIAGWISISNTLNYGPTHTSYTQALINGEPGVIQTSNIDGRVFVTILQQQQNGSIKASTYLGPALDPSAWNYDLRSIVATANVAPDGSIVVHLIGTISYFHLLFARPELTFSLVPDKQAGYKTVQS